MLQHDWGVTRLSSIGGDEQVPPPTDNLVTDSPDNPGTTETVIEVPPNSDVDFVPPSQVPEGAGSFTGLVAGAGVLAATLHNAVKRFGVQLMEHLSTVSTGLTMLSALMSKESSTVAALADSLDEMHDAIARLREQAGGTIEGIVDMASDGEAPPPLPDNPSVRGTDVE